MRKRKELKTWREKMRNIWRPSSNIQSNLLKKSIRIIRINIKQSLSPKSPKSPESPNRIVKKSIVHLNPLGIKQLKDIIEDIYAQKKKYDQKCIETKIPKETMEQYMYSYLNQRYGLKVHLILVAFDYRMGKQHY